MITREEVLKGRDKDYPLTPELEANLNDLLERINRVRTKYDKPFTVTSGYRPGAFNVAAGGAKQSSHQSCQAIDLSDKDGIIKQWCLDNLDFIKECGLYMEDPASTPSWVHLQSRPTHNNPFKP